MLSIIRVIAIICSGLLSGIYLADRAMAHARMSLGASTFVAFQQGVHVNYVRMMPPLLIVAIVSAAIWLIIVRPRWRTTGFWLIAVSLAGLLFIVGITRAINVPLNDQLMTWNSASPPADLKELWAPWERVDGIRTIACITAFILQVAALSFSGSGRSNG